MQRNMTQFVASVSPAAPAIGHRASETRQSLSMPTNAHAVRHSPAPDNSPDTTIKPTEHYSTIELRFVAVASISSH